MDAAQIQALGPAFAAYLRHFEPCFVDAWTVEHLHSYCRGLLSDLPRKSVEPIALAAGTAVRTLQEFLRDHVWDRRLMRDRLQRRVAERLAEVPGDDLGNVGLLDETSVVKKGTKTPGVQRQYCGAVGKQENCIVTVHLGVARGRFKTLLDADLFLPESWASDRARCREAGIPDELTYEPKWRLGLNQLYRALANGIALDWLVFDEGYGCRPEFLAELDQLVELRWAGEVPKSFRCLTTLPRGRRPTRGWAGKRVDDLARFSPVFRDQPWRVVRLERQTLGKQTWEVRAAQVYLLRDRRPTRRTYWLIVARQPATGEVKYIVSNAPARTPLERLLRVCFARWNVEHTFRVAKTEIGFGHYEGRNYAGLMRHLTLCLVTMGFVAEQTDRMRGEKPGDHAGTGVPSAEPAVRSVVDQSPRDQRHRTHSRSHRVSPAA